jgi:hypothetical protein
MTNKMSKARMPNKEMKPKKQKKEDLVEYTISKTFKEDFIYIIGK